MLVDAMKDLVSEANLDCSKSGISLQVRVLIYGVVLRFAPI